MAHDQSGKRVVVTGGAGKLGSACVDELLAHGYVVRVIDRMPLTPWRCPTINADLTDFGEAFDAIAGERAGATNVHAVVHLAAIPSHRSRPNATIFRNNTLSDFNVFEACRRLEIRTIVYASSGSLLGHPFDEPPPYVPLDELPPRSNSAYAMTKAVAETMADQLCRRDPKLKIACLRFMGIVGVGEASQWFAWRQEDAARLKSDLWSYVDARDGAQAIRLAIETEFTGAEIFNIAHDNTMMPRSNDELLREFFPDVPRRGDLGPHDTLVSIAKARRILGFAPRYHWRETIGDSA